MAVPQHTSMEATPAYFIYRDIPVGEPFDPTAPLLFFPAKGSDELFDALRVAFPHLKSHSERMRDAIIQYLLQERHEEQVEASPTMTTDTAATTWPSVCSSGSASLFNSPETLNFATPGSFSNSPYPQAPQLTRQASVATSSQPSPPSLDQMTGVFSLSTSSQAKQRVRRKMTEAEKAEYRKRRIVKACDKCAKRKRKCPHNQAQMEVVSTKSGSRSSKSASPKSAKSGTVPASTKQEPVPVDSFAMDGVDGYMTELDMNSFQSFEDFTMFDDEFPELDMNDFVNFDQPNAENRPYDLFTPDFTPSQQRWPSGNNLQDFVMLDPTLPGQGSLDISTHTELSDQNADFQQLPLELPSLQQGRAGLRVSPSSRTTAQHNSDNTRGQTPNVGVSGNGMLWEHLRTGQLEKPQPTHTAHVHGIPSGGLFYLGEENGVLIETGRKVTLSQATLRLIGTKKAINLFAGLRQGREQSPSTSQSVSMDRVADLLRLLDEHNDGIKKLSSRSGLDVHHPRPLQESLALYDVSKRESSFKRDSGWREGRYLRIRTDAKTEFGQQTFTSMSPSSGPIPAALPQGRPQPPASHAGIQSELAPAMVQIGARSKRTSYSTQDGRTNRSLGEGISSSADLSTELFMLRRRIPKTTARILVTAGETGTTNALSVSPRLHAQNHQPSVQANGGACPRLATSTTPTLVGQDAFGKKASEIARAQGPSSFPAASSSVVVVRLQTPTAPAHNDQVDQHHVVRMHATAKAPETDKGKVISSDSKIIDKTLCSLGNFTFSDERLSDHVRYRDHHGRFAAFAAVALGVFLMASLLVVDVSPSLALLALLAPLSIGDGAKDYAPTWSIFVQCSEKNSSWLAQSVQRKSPSAAFSNGKKQEKDEAVGGKWSRTLMLPFASFAQLRLAF